MGSPLKVGYDWHATGVHCACGDCDFAERCGSGGVPYDVGVVQGKGVFPLLNATSGVVEYVDWLDDNGRPFINVVHFCDPMDTEVEQQLAMYWDMPMAECFASLLEDICDTVDDEAPLKHEAELLPCDTCGSSIISAEPIVLLTTGRLVLPERRPPGVMPVKFEPDANLHEHIICLRCARVANMLRDPPIWGGRLYEVEVSWHAT